ncbi:PAS domain-containing hybrid sensor histidine kinase/response regulator [Sorangium sp. So ce394]|uniref:PAS domain-containing hybrid sensor histidine kinase/response regulator n=1 Tax=Sorangium sp. So ce394 TaxID=3133310 RepID=UPI003F5CB93F
MSVLLQPSGLADPGVKETLRASEERFRLLVETIQDYAIFILDDRGHVATWNPGAERINGYEAREIVGRHFSTFYPPEDVAAGKCDRELEQATALGRVEDEGWRVRKDGTLFWASVVMTALRDRDGALIGFAKITRDLTERRHAEEALRRSEERFRLLVESVKDYAIFMLDPQGVVTTWNRGAQELKGYTAEEILGHHFSRFYRQEDVRAGKCAWMLEVAARDGRVEDEGWRVRKDGSLFWASVIITALRGPHGELVGFAKVTRDLTERRRAEEERLRLVQAQEANRMKDEFLATISHELRTPLNAILGWSSLLCDSVSDPEIAKAFDTIRRNAQAQARIVEDVLDVSRIITGKMRIETRPLSFAAIVDQAIEVVRPAADAKGIELVVQGGGRPLMLLGDPARLQQVVWNLLSNAVKFTEKGGHVRVEIEQAGASIHLAVHDDGRGIDPAMISHVFERFWQADSSITRRFGGLGLGLSIVRHIVELHGGTVSARSAGHGRGSSFFVTLPVRAVASAPEHDAERPPEAAAREPTQAQLDGLRVLVVDDEPDARELVSAVLRPRGAEVHVASSASEALSAIAAVRPDVIVSDVGMADLDGYAFMRSVRAMARDDGGATPAIALTAYTSGASQRLAFEAGYDEHLGKPVHPEDLVRLVRKLGRGQV